METWSNTLSQEPELIVQSFLFLWTVVVESRMSTRSEVSQFDASMVQPAKAFFLKPGAP